MFWQNKCLCCHGLSHNVIFLSKSIFLAEILTRTQAGCHDSVLEEKNNSLEGMVKEKDGLRGDRTQDLYILCLFCPTEAVIPSTNHPSSAGEQCSLHQTCRNTDEPSSEIFLRHPQDRESFIKYFYSLKIAAQLLFAEQNHTLQIQASKYQVIGPCAVQRYRDSAQKYFPKVCVDPYVVFARF